MTLDGKRVCQDTCQATQTLWVLVHASAPQGEAGTGQERGQGGKGIHIEARHLLVVLLGSRRMQRVLLVLIWFRSEIVLSFPASNLQGSRISCLHVRAYVSARSHFDVSVPSNVSERRRS